MSDPFHDRPFPRGALFGAAALVGFAILATSAARFGDLGTMRVTAAAPLEVRELRFVDGPDGSVRVFGVHEQRVVEVLEPGTNGFIRGVMRGLARERKRQDISDEPPFRLVRWADGQLSLDDPSTGRSIRLEAFGPTNAQAFARILAVPGAVP
jgi:putative photosynthetic complex assembly protein